MADLKALSGFPQSSNELDKWRKAGRVFKEGKWFEPVTKDRNGDGRIGVNDKPDVVQSGLQQNQAIGNELAKIQTQTTNLGTDINNLNAGNLKETGAVKVNEPITIAPDTTNIDGKLSVFEQEKIEADARVEQTKKEKEDFEKGGTTAKAKKWWEDLGNKPTTEEKTDSEFEDIGVDPAEFFAERAIDRAEVAGMYDNYNKIDTAKQAQLDSVEQPGVYRSVVNTEKRRIEKDFNRQLNQVAGQINTKLALMAMDKGDFQEAKNFVKDAVANYVFDLKTEYERYDAFESENQGVLEDLDQEYKDALADAKQSARDVYLETEKEKTDVMNLLLQNRNAGISVDDTLEEAVAKVAKQPGGTKFTAQQLLKLEQAGMDPTTNRAGALNLLFGGGGATDDSVRTNNANATIQAKKGADGKIAWETYAQMAQDWIAQGGTTSDFKTSFPPEVYMDENNQNALPGALKPTGGLSPTEMLYQQMILQANAKGGK